MGASNHQSHLKLQVAVRLTIACGSPVIRSDISENFDSGMISGDGTSCVSTERQEETRYENGKNVK